MAADPDPAHRLAATLRRAVSIGVDQEASTESLVRAERLAEELCEELSGRRRPRWYDGEEPAERPGDLARRAYLEQSPIRGRLNPIAPPLEVEGWLEREDGRRVLRARVRMGLAYEGPPHGVHGGWVAALFDDLLGQAQHAVAKAGVTATLSVRYRHVTPLDEDLRLDAWIHEDRGRRVTARATCHASETLTADAEAIFLGVDFERRCAGACWRAGPRTPEPERVSQRVIRSASSHPPKRHLALVLGGGTMRPAAVLRFSSARRTRATRSASTSVAIAGMAIALVALAAGPALADPDGWRALPAVPELAVRFADSEHGAPCAVLATTPRTADVECWAAYVDRAVSKRESPLTTETNLACVSKWQQTAAGRDGCPGDAAGCVRPDVGLFEKVTPDLPIDTNISATWALASDLGREYTAFQTLRSGHALNPHRPRIAGLAASQGMLVLYRAAAIAAIRRQLESLGCGLAHLQPYFDLAERVKGEVGGSDVPEILDSYPPPGQLWARRFYRVQLEVLGRAGGIRPDQEWKGDCEKAADAGRRVGRLDADINVWCGYAYERIGMPDEAFLHWQLARRSPHHPEAASFASRRLGVVGDAAGTSAAVLREGEGAGR